MQQSSQTKIPASILEAYERSQHMTAEALQADTLRIVNKMREQIGAPPLDKLVPVDEHGNAIPEEPIPKPPLSRHIREAWRVLQGK